MGITKRPKYEAMCEAYGVWGLQSDLSMRQCVKHTVFMGITKRPKSEAMCEAYGVWGLQSDLSMRPCVKHTVYKYLVRTRTPQIK
jgi:hypothetical protein